MSRNMRHSLYPEGLLHGRKSCLLRDRGTPGIVRPVALTAERVQNFGRCRDANPLSAYRDCGAIPAKGPPRKFRSFAIILL